MADFKTKYPSDTSLVLTIGLAGLATNSAGVYTIGRESTAVSNLVNQDIDHMLSGRITLGTSPTNNRFLGVWVYAPAYLTAGVPTYPDVLDGTDSDETLTSSSVQNGMLRLAWGVTTENVSNRTYWMPPVSIAGLFNNVMPPFWGVFVAHDTGVALGSGHDLYYTRIQTQSVG